MICSSSTPAFASRTTITSVRTRRPARPVTSGSTRSTKTRATIRKRSPWSSKRTRGLRKQLEHQLQKPCSTFGKQYVNANLQNVPGAFDYNIPQPRFGVTYTVNPNTVLRASYGRYNEQPSAAYEQYNSLEQNLPDTLAQFYSLGFTTPGHQVAPSVSYSSDLSLEHHLPGTDMSFKLTPFLRQTQDQVENFDINYTAGITSGLNAGYQTSSGFEFQFDKGDFARNGFAAQLSFAYTYATVKFSTLPNGTNVLSPINSSIAQYNAYTKACAPGGSAYGKKQFGEALCGYTTNGAYATPCYRGNGTPDSTCKTGDVATRTGSLRPSRSSIRRPHICPTRSFRGPSGRE